MNIVHVVHGRCNPASSNGIDVMVSHLAEHQAREGHDVELWQITSRSTVPIPNVSPIAFPGRRWPLASPRGLADHIQKHRPDVAHIHSAFSPACTVVGRQLHATGIPYIVTPHGALNQGSLQQGHFRKRMYLGLLERKHLSHARAIHALSASEAADVSGLGISTPTFVVPNGVEVQKVSREEGRQFLHERIPATTGKRIYVFLGRLATEQKGLDLLIDGVARARQHLENTRILIAGPDWRNSLASLEAQVHQLGLQDLVIFPGSFVGTEKLYLLAAADLFLHTSRWEGIPMALLEAMASGKPCLVTEATNMAHVIREVAAGFIAEPSPESIAEQLVKVSQIPDAALYAMGERAARTINENYRWDTIARRITRHYS